MRPSRPTSTATHRLLAVSAASALAIAALPAVADAEWSNLGYSSGVEGVRAVDGGTSTFVGPRGDIGITAGTPTDKFGRSGAIAERPTGRPWDTNLRTLGLGSGRPQLAYDAEGDAVLVGASSSNRPTVTAVRDWTYATRTPDGAFGPLARIGRADAGLQENMRVVIDHSRTLVAFWLGAADANGNAPVLSATRPLDGGDWSVARKIGSADTGGISTGYTTPFKEQYSGVIDAPIVSRDGSIVVSWTTGTYQVPNSADVQPTGIAVARRTASGSWRAPATVSVSGTGHYSGYYHQVAVDDSGNVTASLQDVYDPDRTVTPRLATLRSGSASWGSSFTLPVLGPGGSPYLPSGSVAAVDDGQVIVSGAAYDPATQSSSIRVQTSRDGGQTWSPPRTMSAVPGAQDDLLTANHGTNMVTLTYHDVDENGHQRTYARDWYPWSDQFSQNYDVPNRGSGTFIDDVGDTFIPGTADQGGWVVDDVTGPDVDSLTAPSVIKPKKQGSFSIEATDAFSKLGTITWDFGDGTTATGASPKHAFAKAGTYTVSVTVRDEWGYPTATSATVKVAKKIASAATTRAARPKSRAGRVRFSKVRLHSRRLSLVASGRAKAVVSIQRTTTTGRPAGKARQVRVQPQGRGRIVARIATVPPGHYRVRVSGDGAGAVSPLGVSRRVGG